MIKVYIINRGIKIDSESYDNMSKLFIDLSVQIISIRIAVRQKQISIDSLPSQIFLDIRCRLHYFVSERMYTFHLFIWTNCGKMLKHNCFKSICKSWKGTTCLKYFFFQQKFILHFIINCSIKMNFLTKLQIQNKQPKFYYISNLVSNSSLLTIQSVTFYRPWLFWPNNTTNNTTKYFHIYLILKTTKLRLKKPSSGFIFAQYTYLLNLGH